jgi:hypothetical protein
MNTELAHRCRRAALTGVPASLCFLALSWPAVGSQNDMMFFTGGGFGPTVEYAIQSAVWDAEASASGYLMFTCQVVGEPMIFPGPNSKKGRRFTAEATIGCTR